MRPAATRALFWGVTLLVPVLLFVATELCLRATGWLAPEPLVLDMPESQGTMLKFNPWVARRYFDSTAAALPNLQPEVFLRAKPSSTIRVLCLGESSTAGFPFEGSVPFPVQLREILARAHPSRRVEVLNAGISAISSYVVLDMLPELLEVTRPDLVIVYMGHNEFYGIYGSGSTLFPAKKRMLVTLILRLQHLHVVQGVKRVMGVFRSHPASRTEGRTLMQSVVGNQDIALGSDEYRNTVQAFRENLEAVVDQCHDRHVPVILGSLVSNWRDQPPFHSPLPARVDLADRIHALLQAGDSLLAAGAAREAEGKFLEALSADSSSADAWYGIGRAELAVGDSTSARGWFLGAKDRDAMRFRASEDFNAVIAGVAASRNAAAVDLTLPFTQRSRWGIIGSDLMCDHLHPTPRGYFLMAKSLFDGIVSAHLLPPPDPRFVCADTPYGVTGLDWEIGLVKVFPMLHEWPFKPRPIIRGEYHPHGDTAATRIAIRYHKEGFAWVRAHDLLGHLYAQRGEFERARQEYMAIAVYQPDDPWPHEQIARLYEAEGNWPLRSAALQAALLRSPRKGLLAYQLGLSKWKQGDLKNAIVAMDFASTAPDLRPEERWNAQFHLAGFLSDSGRYADAVRTLRAILSENPEFAPARQFLSQLERRRQ